MEHPGVRLSATHLLGLARRARVTGGHVPLDLLLQVKVYGEAMDVTLLYFDGCPNWRDTDTHLRTLQHEFPDLRVTRRIVDTPEEAERAGFHGSPSILIGGVDPFADTDAPVGLTCRMYQTPNGPAGSPTLDQLRQLLLPG